MYTGVGTRDTIGSLSAWGMAPGLFRLGDDDLEDIQRAGTMLADGRSSVSKRSTEKRWKITAETMDDKSWTPGSEASVTIIRSIGARPQAFQFGEPPGSSFKSPVPGQTR